MLIVEGSDLVGKSTVVKKLLESVELQQKGYTPDHFGLLPEGFEYYWGYIDRSARRVVMDRFHMSEIVYGRMIRGGAKIDEEEYRLIDAHLRNLGAVTVIITADASLIKERSLEREEVFNVEQILSVNDGFRQVADRLFAGYEPDFDLHFHCTRDKPFVTSQQLANVAGCYLARQAMLDTIIFRKGRKHGSL
jgi:thymidylate kinase